MTIFKLPDLGEGLPDAEIHEWHVKEGEAVEADQLLVSMETAKAVVEVPSPYTGTIVKLYGKPGDIIETDSPLVEFAVAGVDVTLPEAEIDIPQQAATVAGILEVSDVVLTDNAMGIIKTKTTGERIKATPAVRALAKKMQVDLHSVVPSGRQGEITLDDVSNAASLVLEPPMTSRDIPGMEPLKGVRRTMAQIMTLSHKEVVPIVIMDDANIEHLPSNIDLTTRILKAIAYACQVEPALNAYFDGKTLSRKIHKDVNIGLAMDAAEGLFVPVIKNISQMSEESIRLTIDLYKQQIADRSIPPENLSGATISLSNFGTFAGRYANPIVVPPCVAIIGAGRYRKEVVAVNGMVEIHKILPLSLSFDHRAVTGGEASRFLKAMIDHLQNK